MYCRYGRQSVTFRALTPCVRNIFLALTKGLRSKRYRPLCLIHTGSTSNILYFDLYLNMIVWAAHYVYFTTYIHQFEVTSFRSTLTEYLRSRKYRNTSWMHFIDVLLHENKLIMISYSSRSCAILDKTVTVWNLKSVLWYSR